MDESSSSLRVRLDTLVHFFLPSPTACPPTPRAVRATLTQGRSNNQWRRQLDSFPKHRPAHLSLCRPIEHGNPLGTLRRGEDQPRLQRGHEDSASRRSSGTLSALHLHCCTGCHHCYGKLTKHHRDECLCVLFYFFISSRTQIAAIASRSLERSKEFAKKHGIPKVYGGYEALAKDPNIGEWRAVSDQTDVGGKNLYSAF